MLRPREDPGKDAKFEIDVFAYTLKWRGIQKDEEEEEEHDIWIMKKRLLCTPRWQYTVHEIHHIVYMSVGLVTDRIGGDNGIEV